MRFHFLDLTFKKFNFYHHCCFKNSVTKPLLYLINYWSKKYEKKTAFTCGCVTHSRIVPPADRGMPGRAERYGRMAGKKLCPVIEQKLLGPGQEEEAALVGRSFPRLGLEDLLLPWEFGPVLKQTRRLIQQNKLV